MNTQPHSINLSVNDLSASVDWYTKVLGFHQVYRSSYPDMHLEIAFLASGNFEIEIIQFSKSSAGTQFPDAPRHASVRGITHFSLRVEDLGAAIQAVEDKGVPRVWGPTHFRELDMSVAFFRDPDGNLIKLVQKGGVQPA